MTETLSLWSHRTLIWGLVVRNIKVKYQRSMLGFLWTLIYPLLMVTVLVIVFSAVIRIQIEHFWAFLISGFFAWNCISSNLYAATYTLAEHAQITRSISLPHEALIVSAALSRLIEFLIELVLVLAVLAIALHHHLPASFAFVPLLLAIQFLLTLGLQLPIAALAAFYKDVQDALPVLLSALFYLSPVFYPASMIGGIVPAM